MQPRDKIRLYFFLGLLATALLYSAYNLFILDPYVYERMSRGTRHIYKFGAVIISWLIGFLVFRKRTAGWLVLIWHLAFGVGLAILILFAGYDAAIRELPPPVRQPVSTFHEFLISPIPYVFIGIVSRAVRRNPESGPTPPPGPTSPPGPPASTKEKG
ncbi:MAG TPA: hypothetical protein VKU83_08025 [Puia sp.]|nr:hypothetical protein [Puia sp.]